MHDRLEERAIRASSGSLRKAMRRISERFGLVADVWPPYQECLMWMVEQLVTDAAERGFGQGFLAGARAGVAAALPEGHDEYIRVLPLRREYQVTVEGLDDLVVEAQRCLVAEDDE
jgi:hypothetical protein